MMICQRPDCSIPFSGRSYQKFCCEHCRRIEESRRFRKANPDRVRDYHHRSYLKHRDKSAKNAREWRRKSPEKYLAIIKRSLAIRRAHKNVLSTLTSSEWNALLMAWHYCCAYCGIKTLDLTQDHFVPLSKGGTHTMENIVPACRPCNSKKYNLDIIDFIQGAMRPRRKL